MRHLPRSHSPHGYASSHDTADRERHAVAATSRQHRRDDDDTPAAQQATRCWGEHDDDDTDEGEQRAERMVDAMHSHHGEEQQQRVEQLRADECSRVEQLLQSWLAKIVTIAGAGRRLHGRGDRRSAVRSDNLSHIRQRDLIAELHTLARQCHDPRIVPKRKKAPSGLPFQRAREMSKLTQSRRRRRTAQHRAREATATA